MAQRQTKNEFRRRFSRGCNGAADDVGSGGHHLEVASPPSFPEERLLLHELNHRINNEFAAAISVASLAASRSGNEEVKVALTGVAELLHHYADVHRALQMPDHDAPIDAAAYLRKLCLSIGQSKLAHAKLDLVLAAHPLRLHAERCWRLGMIVYELVTNAARHAFAGTNGEIRVKLLRTGASVECRVLDNGSAPASVQSGRGMQIVRELAKGLGGRFEQRFGPFGSTSILIFPVRRRSRQSVVCNTSTLQHMV